MILVRNIETGLTHTWDWEEGWCEWVEGIDYERVH